MIARGHDGGIAAAVAGDDDVGGEEIDQPVDVAVGERGDEPVGEVGRGVRATPRTAAGWSLTCLRARTAIWRQLSADLVDDAGDLGNS